MNFCNESRLKIIGGINVVEKKDVAQRVCEKFLNLSEKHNFDYVFKASFDKANRSSYESYRGIGIDEGIRQIEDIKKEFGVKVLTDVHNEEQVKKLGNIDILQIPAFLARQTDLVKELALTGKLINIKKPQFISPEQSTNLVNKFKSFGNENIMICERGTCFGYDNLVVDFLGFGVMKEQNDNIPIVFDVTHSLQRREPNQKESGGRRKQIIDLASAGVSQKISSLFVEVHPDPDKALCDGPSAIDFKMLDKLIDRVYKIDDIIK